MNETNKRRTYELIAKYVGQQTGCTIEFQPDVCPQADTKGKRIILPSNLDEKYIYPGLAGLIHEAGHLRDTTYDYHQVIDDKIDFDILNAIEDVRVDLNNFQVLPNIKGFYEKFMDYLKANSVDHSKIPIEAQILINTMHYMTGFDYYDIGDVDKISSFIRQHKLIDRFWDCINRLEHGDLPDAKRIVKEIRAILYQAKQEPTPKPEEGKAGKGEGNPTDSPEPCDDSKSEKTGAPENAQNIKPTGKEEIDLQAVADMGGMSKEIFKNTDPNAKGHTISSAHLGEATRQRFSELLTQKEVKRIDDGQTVDTDNLTAYATGEIDALFKDDITQRFRKSKIIMVLDCSASMRTPMIDNKSRKEVLARAAKAITDQLREIHSIEGINVDYEVRAFGSDYYKLPKENWEKEYIRRNDNSTNMYTGFHEAQAELLADWTVDGNKMVILMTDGEVNIQQIERIKNDILTYNQDVRCMILGVGADPLRDFMENLCNHNILAEEMSDTTILDCISEMIGG
jgi:hypothetical protein